MAIFWRSSMNSGQKRGAFQLFFRGEKTLKFIFSKNPKTIETQKMPFWTFWKLSCFSRIILENYHVPNFHIFHCLWLKICITDFFWSTARSLRHFIQLFFTLNFCKTFFKFKCCIFWCPSESYQNSDQFNCWPFKKYMLIFESAGSFNLHIFCFKSIKANKLRVF